MTTLIGLGNTGSKVVQKVSEYGQYKAVTIDSGKEIKEYSSPEEYENKCPSFKKLFKGVDNDVYLFLSASGNISGACLRILEQLKGKVLNVVCIHSDIVTLSSVGSLQQNLVSGVLQEYARSGLIKNLFLLDNTKIEDLLEDVGLDEYYDKMNETIAYLFHTFMCFENLDASFQFGDLDGGLASIKTFSIINEKGEQKKFFDLSEVTHEIFFFSYNKEKNKNKNYLKDIKKFAQDQISASTKKVGTKIFETTSEDTNTYSLMSTHIVQNAETKKLRTS